MEVNCFLKCGVFKGVKICMEAALKLQWGLNSKGAKFSIGGKS